MNPFDLTGKKAIVTGGSRGLGKSIAEGLCEAGAEVAIFSSSSAAKDTAEEFCARGFKAYGIQAALSDRVSTAKGFQEAFDCLGQRIDILVNCAGIQRRNKCEDFSLTDWDEVITVNLTAVFELCQLAGRKMLLQGGGKIINLASMLSFFGGYTVPAYAASKGGIAQLTKALANEWAGKGIHVNAIAPGYMATEMNTALLQDEKRSAEILARIPANRWGQPEDMKGVAVFLASSASDYMNGAILPVDGGYLGR